MESYFKTRGYVPGGVIVNCRQEDFDFAALPPFLRTLLVTDGTVTKSLEAYFWEPVAVENLKQGEITLQYDLEWLGLKRGEAALQRQVRLKGADSGNVYAYAQSMLKLDLLPQPLRDDLLAGKIGIGELLRECGLETYREILDIGSIRDESLDAVFGAQQCGDLVYRCYRIVIAHQPTILITEKFPRRLYAR